MAASRITGFCEEPDTSGQTAALIARLLDGLPLTPRPYQTIATAIGMSEAAVLARIEAWLADGTLSRFGVVVRHEALGFTANAMVVWDIPDAVVDAVGMAWRGRAGISLCYRRPRRPPVWPYNLFTMIHGRHRQDVEHRVADLAAGLAGDTALPVVPHAVLFTCRAFKQTAPRYGRSAALPAVARTGEDSPAVETLVPDVPVSGTLA